jgi:hypothetical protein
MLELDESLFVEHKGDLGDGTSQQLAKSVSAFANTLGGWLLHRLFSFIAATGAASRSSPAKPSSP